MKSQLNLWILDNLHRYWQRSGMAKAKQTKGKAAASDGERRQSTIYFPVDVLKRAKKYGIDTDRELSEIVSVALVEYLDRIGAPK